MKIQYKSIELVPVDRKNPNTIISYSDINSRNIKDKLYRLVITNPQKNKAIFVEELVSPRIRVHKIEDSLLSDYGTLYYKDCEDEKESGKKLICSRYVSLSGVKNKDFLFALTDKEMKEGIDIFQLVGLERVLLEKQLSKQKERSL